MINSAIDDNGRLERIEQKLDKLATAVEHLATEQEKSAIEQEKFAAEQEKFAIELGKLSVEQEKFNDRFSNYQQATQWVVQLAFTLIASATLTVIITTILKR